jgi:cytochrome c-type biogenesis protein CcmF
MIPELGHFALILACCWPWCRPLPARRLAVGNRPWMAMARPLAYGQFTMLAIAFACLVRPS